jgi:hypothetical protein
MHVQNLMNSLWDIRIFLGLVPKESPCTYCFSSTTVAARTRLIATLHTYLYCLSCSYKITNSLPTKSLYLLCVMYTVGTHIITCTRTVTMCYTITVFCNNCHYRLTICRYIMSTCSIGATCGAVTWKQIVVVRSISVNLGITSHY